MSRFVILLGGDLFRTPRVDAQIAGARVIAADGGIAPCRDARRDAGAVDRRFRFRVRTNSPSAGPTCRARCFPPARTRPMASSPSQAALARGATSLVLAGAFGGQRADHAFLHLALALRLAEAGLPTLLDQRRAGGLSAACRATTASTMRDGTLFSVLGFSELTGLSVDRRALAARPRRPWHSARRCTISNEVTRRSRGSSSAAAARC